MILKICGFSRQIAPWDWWHRYPADRWYRCARARIRFLRHCCVFLFLILPLNAYATMHPAFFFFPQSAMAMLEENRRISPGARQERLISEFERLQSNARLDGNTVSTINKPKDQEAYLLMLSDPRGKERMKAAQTLRRLGYKPRSPRQVAQLLVAEQRFDEAIGLGKAAFESLVLALKDKSDSGIRLEGARGLGELRHPQGTSLLTRHRNDPVAFVRSEILRSLGKQPKTESVPVVVQMIEDDDRAVRFTAMTVLARFGRRFAIDPLVSVLLQGDRADRRHAAKKLEALSWPGSVDWQNRSPKVRLKYYAVKGDWKNFVRIIPSWNISDPSFPLVLILKEGWGVIWFGVPGIILGAVILYILHGLFWDHIKLLLHAGKTRSRSLDVVLNALQNMDKMKTFVYRLNIGERRILDTIHVYSVLAGFAAAYIAFEIFHVFADFRGFGSSETTGAPFSLVELFSALRKHGVREVLSKADWKLVVLFLVSIGMGVGLGVLGKYVLFPQYFVFLPRKIVKKTMAKALVHHQPIVRKTAIQSIHFILEEDAGLLKLAMENPDPEIRLEGIRIYRIRRDSRSIKALTAALTDAHRNVRRAAAEAIGVFKMNLYSAEFLETLRRRLPQKKIKNIEDLPKPGKTEYIYQFGAPMPDFSWALTAPSAVVREAVVDELTWHLFYYDSARALLRALDDEDQLVRHAALPVLQKSPHFPILRFISETVQDEDQVVRERSRDFLDKVDIEETLAAMMDTLRKGDAEVRQGLKRIYLKLGKLAIPSVMAALSGDSHALRSTAARLLEALDYDPDADPG